MWPGGNFPEAVAEDRAPLGFVVFPGSSFSDEQGRVLGVTGSFDRMFLEAG